MPDTNQRLRSLWNRVQQGWNELQEAIKEHRAMDPRGDGESIRRARDRVQAAMKAHSEAINAYTELFNSRVHPNRRTIERKARKDA
jgi:hypothetical protein